MNNLIAKYKSKNQLFTLMICQAINTTQLLKEINYYIDDLLSNKHQSIYNSSMKFIQIKKNLKLYMASSG